MVRLMSKSALLAIVALALSACGGGSSGSPPPPPPPASFTYAVPADAGDGWQVADLADEGLETQRIVDMMNDILDGTYPGIDSVAIIRNNKLVHYWYDRNREIDRFDDWVGNRDRERHILHSTSKSFTSALIGIAIDQGHIASTQAKFLDLFSYTSYDNWDRTDEKWLLITASGGNLSKHAGPPMQNVNWADPKLLDLCRKSPRASSWATLIDVVMTDNIANTIRSYLCTVGGAS